MFESNAIIAKQSLRLNPVFITAMYVAYALGVALMLGVTLVYWLFSERFLVIAAFLSITGILLIVSPYLNAWSKLIWANFFFHYDSDLK